VVVVVLVGEGEGQTGRETTEEMESAVRVRVVSCALTAVAARAAKTRDLIAMVRE
jgi:hypothetical protein